jgi:hypothetical protein
MPAWVGNMIPDSALLAQTELILRSIDVILINEFLHGGKKVTSVRMNCTEHIPIVRRIQSFLILIYDSLNCTRADNNVRFVTAIFAFASLNTRNFEVLVSTARY